jgi:hypothetical protein
MEHGAKTQMEFLILKFAIRNYLPMLSALCPKLFLIDRSKAHAQRGVPMYEHRYKWETLDDKNELACSCPSRAPH